MTTSTNWRSQLNDQSFSCFHCGLLQSPWHLNFREPPLLSSSLHVCMWDVCPVPNRRTGTSWRKARGRVYTQCTSPLPQLGEDQGTRKPQRKTFHYATWFFREALSQAHSCSASKEVSKIPDGQVKITFISTKSI